MGDNSIIYISRKESDTIWLGELMGKMLDPGQIILLAGELGAGKTILAQGIARGLEIEDELTSPTYNLINEYEGELPLFHMDLYRLEEERELFELGFEDYLDRGGIVIVEWPDLAYDLLPPDFIYININVKNKKREIIIEAEGEKGLRVIGRLNKHVGNGY